MKISVKKNGKSRDEPFIYTVEKLRAAFDQRLPKPDIASVKVEILSAIQSLLVPSTVLKTIFINLYPNLKISGYSVSNSLHNMRHLFSPHT